MLGSHIALCQLLHNPSHLSHSTKHGKSGRKNNTYFDSGQTFFNVRFHCWLSQLKPNQVQY